MKRFGSAAWNGGLREGKGSVSTESGALDTYPYTGHMCIRSVPGAKREGQQRVDMARSPSHRRTAGVLRKAVMRPAGCSASQALVSLEMCAE